MNPQNHRTPAYLTLIVLLLLTTAAASYAQEKVINLNVSGYPVDSRILQYFIFETIFDHLRPISGSLLWADVRGLPKKISPGRSAFLDVPIKFLRRDGSPAKDRLYIFVRNLAVEGTKDCRLMVSNDPEVIKDEGALLSERMSRDIPVRLLYYHEAAPGKRFKLALTVTNPNPYPIDILVSKGVGGPCKDGIYAGHVATTRFMRQEKADAGRILKILPRSTIVISDQEVKEAEISSGIVKLRQISGDGALLKLAAVKDGSFSRGDAPSLNSKEDGRISGALDQGQIDMKEKFRFGQKPLDIRIGEGPTLIPEAGGFDIHLGNYGVLHRINLLLTNGSGRKRTAALFYVATGGPARGVFVINGSLFETGLLDPKGAKSQKLTSISVPAKGSKSVSVLMMPEPGSFYPTRLVLLEERP